MIDTEITSLAYEVSFDKGCVDSLFRGAYLRASIYMVVSGGVSKVCGENITLRFQIFCTYWASRVL